MSLMGYDLEKIGGPIGRLAVAHEELAKAEKRQAAALERIAHALEQHWAVVMVS